MLICLHQRGAPRVSSESFLFSCFARCLHNDGDDDAFSISTEWMRKISQFWLSQLSGLSICTACTLIMPPCIVICEGSTSFRFAALECTLLALISFKGARARSMSRRAVFSQRRANFLARWQHKQHIAARRCPRASRFTPLHLASLFSPREHRGWRQLTHRKTHTTSHSQLLWPTKLTVDTNPSHRWSSQHLRPHCVTLNCTLN